MVYGREAVDSVAVNNRQSRLTSNLGRRHGRRARVRTRKAKLYAVAHQVGAGGLKAERSDATGDGAGKAVSFGSWWQSEGTHSVDSRYSECLVQLTRQRWQAPALEGS
jgi:hypothetical protein